MPVPDRPPSDRAHLEAAAFRELHGRRLHGFALLLTLGDRQRAAALAGEALTAGTHHVEELRHPERAAAWLRRRVTRRAGRSIREPGDGAAGLDSLGVDERTRAGLAALDSRTRAAVIGRVVEGFDPRDVATIVDREGRDLSRLLERGIARFAAARSAATAPAPADAGPIVARIHEAARRAIT
jgi:DNA-directed RNA polymerase specialized sigma24 family protein